MRNKFDFEASFDFFGNDLQEDLKQPCPQCGYPIGVVAGSKDAICTNCGYKDPCCE